VPARYTVHTVAADLRLSDEDILTVCSRLGIEADAPSSLLDENGVRKIRHSVTRSKIEKVEEVERIKREEEERKKSEAEAKKRAEADEKRKIADAKKAEAEKKKADAARKKSEMERKKREQEEQIRLEAERKKREEEEKKKEEEHKKREEARRLAEEEIKRKEDTERKKHEAETARKKAEEEKVEQARKRAEEKARQERIKEMKQKLRIVEIDKLVAVKSIAPRFAFEPKDMIKKLEELGLKVAQTTHLDKDTIAIFAQEIGYEVIFKDELAAPEDIIKTEAAEKRVEDAIREADEKAKRAFEEKAKKPETQESKKPVSRKESKEKAAPVPEDELPDDPKDLVPRAPIVTVMGHVDHGKTSILDYIRKAKVAAGEKGGITQHIGAYKTKHKGREIVFIDTPGHEAFTEMRARGAKVTDLVVLVIAADDGIMPQTVEAINHARSANVPIIIALNKIDKHTASPGQIKQQLMQYQLLPEEWGGETIVCEVSAVTGAGIDHLLEMITIQSEMMELKANPKRKMTGVVIESKISRGRGAVATIIVNRGTLKVGDIVVSGKSYGKVRALSDEHGKRVQSAGPATPVEVMGLSEPPMAGEMIRQANSESEAREIVSHYIEKEKADAKTEKAGFSLEDFLKGPDEEMKELRIVLKGDVQGTVEALSSSLEKVSTEKAKVKILHAAVGAVGEADVQLANASGAIILAFNVKSDQDAAALAEREKVKIRYHDIIYHAIEEIRAVLEGLLEPIFNEVVAGKIEVRQLFESSSLGIIAGCSVQTGVVNRNSKARVLRGGKLIWEGEIASLKRFKDEAREVKAGMDCGIRLLNFNDIQVGDIIEAVKMERVAQTL
jgi:translation initiation factor IF-2